MAELNSSKKTILAPKAQIFSIQPFAEIDCQSLIYPKEQKVPEMVTVLTVKYFTVFKK